MSLPRILLFSFCWLCVLTIAVTSIRTMIAPNTFPENLVIGCAAAAAGYFAGSQARRTT